MANREFKIELDNVEMVNGSDDLLKDTKVTKVTLTGENKLNSLNSTFENCTELTAIEGDINLEGVSDMTEMTLNTPLDEVKVTNPTEETIQATNSLNQATNVKIGGTKYSKGGIQDVVGSLEWDAENFTYEDTILENVYTNSSNIIDNKNLTIQDTLEQKATSFEVTGQTYMNLVDGKNNQTLLDEMSMQQVEGSPTNFAPHIEQPICVESIEGQTYQNLVDGKGERVLIDEYKTTINDFIPNTFEPPQNQPICIESMEGETYQNLIKGKGEYKLTDAYSHTWTAENNKLENMPNAVEIPEIWGNTVQGYGNVVSAKMIVDSINNSGAGTATLNSSNTELFTVQTHTPSNPTNSDNFIQLKPNTTYSVACYGSNYKYRNYVTYFLGDNPTSPAGSTNTSPTFTTDSSGKVLFYPPSVQNQLVCIRCIEGVYPLNIWTYDTLDLNYIQSVGELYTDSEGSPILDEDSNEQYKLDIISHGYAKDIININNQGEGRNIAQNIKIPKNTLYTLGTHYIMTPKMLFHIIAKIDFTQAQSGYFYALTQGGAYGVKFNKSSSTLILVHDNTEYILGSIKHNEPFMFTHRQTYDDSTKTYNLSYYLNGTLVLNIPDSSWGYQGNINLTFNSYFHTGYGGGCNGITVIYAQNATSYTNACEEDWDKINQWNNITILMPQPLRRAGYERYGYNNNTNQYDKPIRDILYYDTIEKKFFIKKYVMTNYRTDTSFIENSIYRQYNTREIIPPVSINQTLGYIYAIRYFFESLEKSKLKVISIGGNTSQSALLATLREEFTVEESNALFSDVAVWYAYYKNDTELYYETVETKILEKPSLETYSPKTIIQTDSEVQPSQMSITNKRNLFNPLSLTPSTNYTLQLDSIGKDDKAITVNLGGTESTIQPTNGTSTHHRVTITTPSELTTDNLELFGEGVVVNDVMLFEGNTSEIKQDVDYMDGIQSIGELFESRNLFDYTQSEVGLLDHTNGNISDDNSWKYTTDFISVKPNTTYCISQTSGSVFNYKIVEYNSSKAYLKGTNWTSSKGTDINRAYNTFTTSANTYYLRLGWQSSSFEIQLEEDTFPTEFMAFDTVRYKLEIQTYDPTWDSI